MVVTGSSVVGKRKGRMCNRGVMGNRVGGVVVCVVCMCVANRKGPVKRVKNGEQTNA